MIYSVAVLRARMLSGSRQRPQEAELVACERRSLGGATSSSCSCALPNRYFILLNERKRTESHRQLLKLAIIVHGSRSSV